MDPLFELVIGVLREVEKKEGELAFAMLHRSLSAPRQWSLTVAAPSIDQRSRLTVTGEILDMLRHRLGSANERLGRVFVRSTHDSIVQTLAPLLSVTQLGTAYQVDPLELSLFDIDEAVYLVSRPELVSFALSA